LSVGYNWSCSNTIHASPVSQSIWKPSFQVWVRLMAFNSTFNNISVVSWRSVYLVEETRVPGENHWPVTSHWKTLSHNVVSSTPRLNGGSFHHWFVFSSFHNTTQIFLSEGLKQITIDTILWIKITLTFKNSR
jgi:hypothetical protein